MQEIPKLFTVAAEWSSCVVFAVVLKNRFSRGKTAGILAGPAMALMYLCIFVSYEIW